ncbi:hypothetical protein [Fulvivirga ligni]|uniref:hypothetical protein n=1 Tax=Fulvivirga ligni TaxID=2904246 RepID=UPI001F1E3589|nr:hypothetical protein [Fulvivirga ligni]UII19265.1 hypothetical protein LVD16_15580 [Fulvivirga ligni]
MASHTEIPFRDAESYDVVVDYTFKKRPTSAYMLNSGIDDNSVLPYLSININMNILKATDYKVKVEDGKGNQIMCKKLKRPINFTVDMGYTEDILDGITPTTYYVYFQDKLEQSISQLKIEVKEDGSLYFNDKFQQKL